MKYSLWGCLQEGEGVWGVSGISWGVLFREGEFGLFLLQPFLDPVF